MNEIMNINMTRSNVSVQFKQFSLHRRLMYIIATFSNNLRISPWLLFVVYRCGFTRREDVCLQTLRISAQLLSTRGCLEDDPFEGTL